jgi:hypothetical protein
MSGHIGTLTGTPSNTAEHQPQFDFTEELQRALQHAPLIHPTDSLESVVEYQGLIQEQLRPMINRPDDYLEFRGTGKRMPDQVRTDNRDAYPFLLEQALAVVRGEPSTSNRRARKTAMETTAHEFEHADAIREVSSSIAIQYGVRFVRFVGTYDHERPKPAVGPFVTPIGWLRKLDLAYIGAAPTDLSEDDVAVIHALGYASPEEVMERYADSPSRRLSAGDILNIVTKGIAGIE